MSVADAPGARARGAAMIRRPGVAMMIGGLAAVAVASVLLPRGVPLGVLLLGVVLGSLHGLTAMGIVLVYRSSRIINFAQAEIGGLASALAVLLVTGRNVPYLVAVPIGIVAALAVGAAVDVTVVKRVSRAPRLIGTVAMVGVAQILGAFQLVLPHLFTDNLKPFTVYKTPFEFSFRIGPILFRGDHVLAVAGAVGLAVAVSWFLGRTRTGTAIRGSAEAPERAALAGIPVRRLSTITWMVSAGLSGVAALLATPIVGVSLGAIAGPSALVIPLTAAVLARLESLPRALLAAIGITVVQQVVFWSYESSSFVDVIILAIVAVGLALQPTGAIREGGDLAGTAAAAEPRRLTSDERRQPLVRALGITLAIASALALLLLPRAASASDVSLAANIVIYCMIAVSALVLTGWSGQISLGQFALVGVGAAATSALVVHTNGDLFIELLISGLTASAVAVCLGAFTRRVSGILLAVVTLAAATAFSSYFFSSEHFPLWTPPVIGRPQILNRISIDAPLPFYYFCLIFLALTVALALGFRRSYIGRAVIAARDNERAAAANGINVTRAKLFALGFSGFLAGIAGGLYALSLRGFGFQAFSANESLQVFLLVVIGGLGSIWGALAGALYGQGVFYFTSGAAELLGTGAGLLLMVMIFPGGFAQVGYKVRDAVVRRLGTRRDTALPVLAVELDEADSTPSLERTGSAVLEFVGLEAGYDNVQVLFGATGYVFADSTLAIVGVNGVGKTTLLKALAGVVPVRSGAIRLFGEDVTAMSPHERVDRGMVLVVGGAGVFRLLSVDENLQLGAWSRTDGAVEIEATKRRVFALFPILEQRASTRAELLSGGEQQMLALAMGLMSNPRVLLVDELSLGLAPLVIDSILDVLNQLRGEGTVVVAVEQSAPIAARIADRVGTMARGRIVATSPAAEQASLVTLWAEPARTNGAHEERPSDLPVDLRAVGLSKRYGGVAAVDAVSLDVSKGEFLGIIGANGAGKTTLLDLLSGFVRPDEGRVEILRRDVTSWSPDRRAELGLGRVFQHARLFPNLTVRETVAVALSRRAPVREPIAHIVRLPAAARSERWVFAQVDLVLEQLELGRYRDTTLRELSTGTRRAIELACVVANRPKVLLLDEPTAGIGEDETAGLADILVNLHRDSGATFVMIEHDVDLIARLSERLVCMDHGTVIADGTPAAVLASPEVLAAYLGPGAARRVSGGDTNGRPRKARARLTASRQASGCADG